MTRYKYIFILFFRSVVTDAQTEIKKQSDINHVVGIDVGYSDYASIVGYNGEVNLNYIFNPHYFCVKTQIGIAPTTNFGTLTKTFISMGFSTKINRLISWHLLHGIGKVFPSKNDYNGFKMFSNGPILETGFYIKPLKIKNSIIGLNIVVSDHAIYLGDKALSYGYILMYNLSYNLKLNK